MLARAVRARSQVRKGCRARKFGLGSGKRAFGSGLGKGEAARSLQEWIKKAQGLGKDRAPAKDSESYRIWKRNLLDHGVVKGLAKGNLLAQV